MNILCVFGYKIGIGGHFKSCFSMINGITNNVFRFYVTAPGYEKEILNIVNNKIQKIYIIKTLQYREPLFNLFSFFKIIKICKNKKINVIHVQDFKGLAPSIIAAYILGLKIIYTKAGGPLGYNIPPKNIFTILFSKELMDGFINKYGYQDKFLSLVKARIDMDIFKKKEISYEFLTKYNLFGKCKYKIAIAIRMTKAKEPWINSLFKIAKILSANDIDIEIIIAGDGNLFSFFKRQGQVLNDSFDKNIVKFIGPVLNNDDMVQLYNYADLVFGHGRGILEAMACGKPVVVLNKNGSGEFVKPDNVEKISKYNFSGRHSEVISDTDDVLLVEMKDVFFSKKNREKLGKFCYTYIQKEMDAKIGARNLQNIYLSKIPGLKSWRLFSIWLFIFGVRSIKEIFRELIKK